MSARSVWFARPNTVELRDEALEPLGPTDVRIRACVSAISHGTEMLVFRGNVPAELALDLPTLKGSFAFPIKYGYASVGRVEEVGSDTTRLRTGDLVFVHHPHQTSYVVPETTAIRLLDDTSADAGVFLANVETAVNVVLDAAPRIGERVLVSGQGVVGLLITAVLRRTGVAEIIVVDPVAQRRSLACKVGADRALSPEEVRAGALSEMTSGAGVDIAIEVSGAPAALDDAIENVTFGGTLIVASWYGTKTVPLHLGGAFHRRRLKLVSSQVSTIDAALQPRWTHGRRLTVARDLLKSLHPGQLISHRFPIDDAASAYELVDRRPEDAVQVVLTYP